MNPRDFAWIRFIVSILHHTVKAEAKKYIVTDTGAHSDLTKPTHHYHVQIVPIRGLKSCVLWSTKNPSSESDLVSLTQIQDIMPSEQYSQLMLILTTEQIRRYQKAQKTHSYWHQEAA